MAMGTWLLKRKTGETGGTFGCQGMQRSVRVLSWKVVVCQGDNAALFVLTWTFRSRESRPGDEGWLGLQSALALSSHWWALSGLHFHLEKHRVFLQGLNHRSPDPTGWEIIVFTLMLLCGRCFLASQAVCCEGSQQFIPELIYSAERCHSKGWQWNLV